MVDIEGDQSNDSKMQEDSESTQTQILTILTILFGMISEFFPYCYIFVVFCSLYLVYSTGLDRQLFDQNDHINMYGLSNKEQNDRFLYGVAFFLIGSWALALSTKTAAVHLFITILPGSKLDLLLTSIRYLLSIGRGYATIGIWYGLSYIIASLTSYRGIPELGAILSLFRSNPIRTKLLVDDREHAN